jgi:hypothetical protein
MFVRFQSPTPNHRGVHPGIFAIVNTLARDGALSPEHWTQWRADNDGFNAAYIDPATIDPLVFDRELHPGAISWFKEEAAAHLIGRLAGHLRLLDLYEAPIQTIRTEDPGVTVYADDVQVIAKPRL